MVYSFVLKKKNFWTSFLLRQQLLARPSSLQRRLLHFQNNHCCSLTISIINLSHNIGKGMEGNTGQKWNWINLYQTAWCIISYHVVTYPAKQQTSRWTNIPYPIHRVIVSDMPLHRTVCCYIVPGAAKLSSMCGDRVHVIPQNCSLCCYIAFSVLHCERCAKIC